MAVYVVMTPCDDDWQALKRPSGSRLGTFAGFLSRHVANLQLRHGLEEMAVVAHRRAGLGKRSCVFGMPHESICEAGNHERR